MDCVSSVTEWTRALSITDAFWVYYGFFVVHELEEWNIARFEKRVFKGLPAVHTDRNARAWIGVVCLLGLAWCAAASLASRPGVAAGIFLPAVFVCATNALQHVYWSLRFRAVAPGLVTAVLLILPASAYLVWLALARGLLSPWYVAALSAVALLPLAGTVKTGTDAPAIVPIIYGIGDRAAGLFSSTAAREPGRRAGPFRRSPS